MTPLALAVAARGGRVLRYAGSELARTGTLGFHGWRAGRSATGDGLQAARTRLYRGYWLDAADALDATVSDLGRGLLQIAGRGRTVRVWHNLVPLDHPVALKVAGDRRLAAAALATAGLRTARAVTCSPGSTDAARALLASVGSCVVKAAADTGAGTSVTCGVQDSRQLAGALAYAARWSPEAVVEEQVAGRELRLLVLDGQVLGTLERRPPELVGDGRHTVAELVALETAERERAAGDAGLFPLSLDLDVAFTQRRCGRTLRTVVPAGVVFAAKTAANENGPAQNRGLQEPPDGLAGLARRAADAVGLRLAAVEVVLPSAGGDPVVLEVNSTPGLHYHYQVAEGTYVARVTRPLLERLLSPAGS